ncbi:hypothetical protein FT663_02747 [Candidozyma haemuli var. vulneris]|nr:hypothetical protein FT662_02836 [[Candida] haemuloni var. vulneris]KAF3991340.1 hypothetical protein FT663_02747 [[Candida] haemuloni var. vulneris]
MHIKKITVQGFKTFKATTVVDDLSPEFNVVVGRNGSGKSNFFAAIRFVLSDAYTHMTREERQGLIHEGSGTVMSAFVEILFDNSDKRFPLPHDEVAIRRTIGLKKDDYSLDGKLVTRSDVMNLLESAGFSRSNPYYIVPQGRITSITNSRDSERLNLLKDVSGAKVFETKLKESSREMSNSDLKMQRIIEAMERLDNKLADLAIESNDLKDFQSFESNRKVLEFHLFDRELTNLNTQNETLEESYDALLHQTRKDLEDIEKREKLCEDLSGKMKSIRHSITLATLEKQQADSDYYRILQEIGVKEANEKELEASLGNAQSEAQEHAQKREKFSALLQAHEEKINSELRPQLNKLLEEETRLKEEINKLGAKQSALYSKQSRFQSFSDKDGRDNWLKEQLTGLNDLLETKRAEHEKALEEYSELETQFTDVKKLVKESRVKSDQGASQMADKNIDAEVSKTKGHVAELTEKRKALWREDIKLRSLHEATELELSDANHKVSQTMARSQAEGLKEVQNITERLNLQGSVYGPLSDLFVVSDKYKTAVEVIAGTSLFHVVVDNDETASIIMKELQRLKKGRVTFMPLNRIYTPPISFPDQEEQEFIPLIKKIRHDEDLVGKAIEHVFGRAIVCKDLHRGAELARMHKLTAITLDGDRASNQGVMTGGFREYKNSRLDALRIQTKKRNELKRLSEAIKVCAGNLSDVDKELSETNVKLDEQLNELNTMKLDRERRKAELSQRLNNKFMIEKKLLTANRDASNVANTLRSIEAKKVQFTDELASDFTVQLSEAEMQKLADINQELEKCEGRLDTIVSEVSLKETEIAKLEAECVQWNSHLSVEFNEFSERERSIELTTLQKELGSLRSKVSAVKRNCDNTNKELEKLNTKMTDNQKKLDDANKEQASSVKRLEKLSKKTENIQSKRSILDARRKELQAKVGNLGVLPEEAFEANKFEERTSDDLLAELTSVNGELKKYAHINKKAMEQFNTFKREQEDLVTRKDELVRSKESIEKLIESLSQQKHHAIMNCFRQVSKSFHEIFEKLVPNGAGELVLLRKEGVTDDQSPDLYNGVSLTVSFNSKSDEQQHIEQLSGGQKSLCAIALILAIQRCDPAPFYLFDEIDANLDTQYRTAVANMIKSLAQDAQFICTTFRPEMLQAAGNFYGVSFADKVSSITGIERSEALSFVEGQR